LHIGAEGTDHIVHGLGWNSYIGPSPSPLPSASGPNPFGAGLAAILAIARLFAHELNPPAAPFLFNSLDWAEGLAPAGAAPPNLSNLGELWFAGVGSVGSAALYFLTLATREFLPTLFDMDKVKVHNLGRSPVFTADDAKHGRDKVKAVEQYLLNVGIQTVTAEASALHESATWLGRQAGRPDVIVSAANELNVRNFIEEAFPPLQLYATTGKNWQVTLIRHIPLKDPCSLCLFPNTSAGPATKCATGAMPDKGENGAPPIDAALPFLSFAAGLMTAAELTKLAHATYPYSTNRVFLQFLPEPNLKTAWMSHRSDCPCRIRSKNVHRQMIAGSRYQLFSEA
jgi:molybdopterin/thiamine biosynthesis adenylyltransferase